MSSRSYDPSDTIADGLAVFAVAINDDSVTDRGAAAYRRVYRAVREQMRPGDTCRLALPSTLVRPDPRMACLVVVLPDRVLIAYERGLLRRRPTALVIPVGSITCVRRHPGAAGGPTGSVLLTIAGVPSATITLPPHAAAEAATAIRAVLQPTTS